MIGASPIDSSSSTSRAGSVARPRAIASICCSPPDSVPAVCAAALARAAGSGVGRLLDLASATRPRWVIIQRFSRTVRFGKMPRPSGMRHSPRRARSSGRAPLTRRPATRTSPAGRGWQPGDDPQRRRLAGAVRSEQRDDAALGARRGRRRAARRCRRSRRGCRAARAAARRPRPSGGRRRAHVGRLLAGAEVGGEHRLVVLDLGGGARGDDPAEVEDVDLVAHLHHELHVVLDQHDGHALAGQLGAAARRTARSRSRPGPTPARRAAAPSACRRAPGRARRAGPGRSAATSTRTSATSPQARPAR